jgi:hypothetical protein
VFTLDNATPFAAALTVHEDIAGAPWIAATVKATFTVAGGRWLERAEEQDEVRHADEYHGAPGASSVRLPSDIAPFKPATDIIMVGHAYAPDGRPARVVDVTLAVGPVAKTVRVFGDRVWRRGLFGLRRSRPAPFTRMPLVYERAFGGTSRAPRDSVRPTWEPRNPVGVGIHRRRRDARRSALANIEDPRHLVRRWRDRPAPQGFGPIDSSWQPRAMHAGTHDDAWRERRAPLLPEDFDNRFFQSAHPDLVAHGYLAGDERVRVVNAVPEGEWDVALPAIAIGVAVAANRTDTGYIANLDTVLVRPDDAIINLTWRSMIPVRGSLVGIDRVRVFPLSVRAAAELARARAW